MKLAECFKKGLLKKTSPDLGNALRSLEISRHLIHTEDSGIMQFMGLISI